MKKQSKKPKAARSEKSTLGRLAQSKVGAIKKIALTQNLPVYAQGPP